MSDIVEQAKNYATSAHQRIDQRRKYSNQPYHVHLEAVAATVATVSDDDEMIAAAWLHDVVEDTPATLEDLESAFGQDIMQLVRELTDISLPSDGNRAKRKTIDRLHIAKASPRAKTVKLADLIDNCKDITKHDPRFARVYLAEMSELLNILGDGDSRLYKQAYDLHKKCWQKIESKSGKQKKTVPALALSNFWSPIPQPHFKRLFAEMFTAKDLAEPLLSFDAEKSCTEVFKALDIYQQQVASIRVHGAVRGFIQKYQIADVQHDCAEHIRHFSVDQVIAGDAPIFDVIHILTRHNYCFVQLLGDVVGFIDRDAINKPIVRMWLFGIITMIEMWLVSLIKENYPDNSWTSQVSEARLQSAQHLQSERLRRNNRCDLLDCLQLSDKAQIMLNNQSTFDALGFRSKKAAKLVIKEIETLRNHLAHAQDIAEHNWAQIVRLTQRMDELTRG